MHAVFEATNIYGHLSSSMGGDRKPGCIKTMINRMIIVLVWTYDMWGKRSPSTTAVLSADNMVAWMQQLFVKEYSMVSIFCEEYLQDKRAMKASTIKGWVDHIAAIVEWFLFFSNITSDKFVILSTDDTAITKVLTKIRKSCRKREHLEKNEKTLKSAVHNHELPPDGLAGLQASVQSQIPLAMAILKQCERTNSVSATEYRDYMSVIYCAFYTDSVTGRVSALEDMRVGQMVELLDQGFAMSSQFKTYAKFGMSSISNNDVVDPLLVGIPHLV